MQHRLRNLNIRPGLGLTSVIAMVGNLVRQFVQVHRQVMTGKLSGTVVRKCALHLTLLVEVVVAVALEGSPDTQKTHNVSRVVVIKIKFYGAACTHQDILCYSLYKKGETWMVIQVCLLSWNAMLLLFSGKASGVKITKNSVAPTKNWALSLNNSIVEALDFGLSDGENGKKWKLLRSNNLMSSTKQMNHHHELLKISISSKFWQFFPWPCKWWTLKKKKTKIRYTCMVGRHPRPLL